MIRYCVLLLLLALVGCTTTYSPLKREKTQLTAWGEDQNSVYLLTDAQQAYQFPKTELKPLITFLHSPLGKKLSHLSISTEIRPKQEVYINFYFYAAAANLSDEEKDELVNTYQFERVETYPGTYYYTIPALKTPLEINNIIYTKKQTIAKGSILSAVPEPDSTTSFANPLEAEIVYMKGTRDINSEIGRTIEVIVWAPFLLIVAPAAIFHN